MTKSIANHQRHVHKTLVVQKKKDTKLVDRATYLVAIIEPIVTIPQVYIIFHDKTAEGIALSSWLGYQLFTLIWLWYGIVHKEKVIIFYQLCWFVLQTIILIGGLMYGAKWY
jgi:uncharacterized protein with PQ loop repeat